MDDKEEAVRIKKSTLIIAGVIVLILIAGLFAYNYRSYFLKSEKNSGETPGEKIELQVIALSVDCEKCMNTSVALGLIKQAPAIKLTKERTVESDSEKGKDLIKKYGIEKLPAFIFVGDIEKLPKENFLIKDDVAILEPVVPPFVDVATGNVRGVVDITYIVDKTCNDCYDPSIVKSMLEQNLFVVFGNEEIADVSSEKGKELLRIHKITKVPTIILSEDASFHPVLPQLWLEAGIVSEGKYVLTELSQMQGIKYKDLIANKIVDTSKALNTGDK